MKQQQQHDIICKEASEKNKGFKVYRKVFLCKCLHVRYVQVSKNILDICKKFQVLALSERHIGAANSSSTFHRISEAWDGMHTLNSQFLDFIH